MEGDTSKISKDKVQDRGGSENREGIARPEKDDEEEADLGIDPKIVREEPSIGMMMPPQQEELGWFWVIWQLK